MIGIMRIIDHSTYQSPPDIHKVLLIQLGDIGDVVWTTPSIRAAKNSLPGATVSVLVKTGFGGLLTADPNIDTIYETPEATGNILKQAAAQWSLMKKLRAQHFDLVVDLRLGDRGAFMALATGAPVRVTKYHPEGMPWLRKLLFTHAAIPADRPPERGATEQSLQILRVLGMDTTDKVPHLWISDAVIKRAGTILHLAKVDTTKPWITVNPFSRWHYKEWRDSGWVEIINGLWRDFGLGTIVIGSKAERQRADELIHRCDAEVFNFAGLTTLAELAAVLHRSLLHIGVDSAAPHIAAAAGRPTVTIYGPSSWFDWAPLGEDHRVVLPDVDCAPCRRKGCEGSGQSRCLDELSVERVRKTVYEVMETHGLADRRGH